MRYPKLARDNKVNEANSVFRVQFFKNLNDSSGHPHVCIEGEVETMAIDEAAAVLVARQQFADLKGVPDWSHRADYELVERIPGEANAHSSHNRSYEASR